MPPKATTKAPAVPAAVAAIPAAAADKSAVDRVAALPAAAPTMGPAALALVAPLAAAPPVAASPAAATAPAVVAPAKAPTKGLAAPALVAPLAAAAPVAASSAAATVPKTGHCPRAVVPAAKAARASGSASLAAAAPAQSAPWNLPGKSVVEYQREYDRHRTKSAPPGDRLVYSGTALEASDDDAYDDEEEEYLANRHDNDDDDYDDYEDDRHQTDDDDEKLSIGPGPTRTSGPLTEDEQLHVWSVWAHSGRISDAVHQQLVQRLLSLPPPVVVAAGVSAAPPSVAPIFVQQEDNTKTAERQLLAAVSQWVGTQEKPHVAGACWEALSGAAETLWVREKVADLKSASVANREYTSLFLSAGDGVVPQILQTTELTPSQLVKLARLGAWSFLTDLVCVVATDLCLRPEPGEPAVSHETRRQFAADLRAQMETQRHTTQKLALMAGVAKFRTARVSVTKAVTSDPVKRERDGQRRRSPTRRRSLSPRRTEQDGRCFHCNLPGHKAFECPHTRTTREGRGRTGVKHETPRTREDRPRPPPAAAAAGTIPPRPRHGDDGAIRVKRQRRE